MTSSALLRPVSAPAAAPSAGTRIPSLDGLRALSIALVLTLHLSDSRHFLRYSQIEDYDLGNLGVRIFFVISGFLITTLLLEELAKRGRISLRQFYFRRAMRIFPVFYAYLLVAAALWGLGWIPLAPADLLRAITYTANYQPMNEGSWHLAHLWSLSVEEQFYLLWPAVLAVGASRRRGAQVAAATLLCVPLLRIALWVWVPSYRPLVGRSFETVCDALAGGCLLACTRDWLWAQPAYRRFLGSWLFALVPLGVLLTSMLVHRPRISFGVGQTVNIVCIALCIDWAVRFPASRLGRVLNARPLVWLGTLSYSLYLWQQFFLVQFRYPDAAWNWFPLNLGLALGAAVLSYHLVEQPFLRLRHRLSKPRARATRSRSYQRTRDQAHAEGVGHGAASGRIEPRMNTNGHG